MAFLSLTKRRFKRFLASFCLTLVLFACCSIFRPSNIPTPAPSRLHPRALSTKHVALPFDHPHHSPNFTVPATKHQAPIKRQAPPTLTLEQARCRGERILGQIQDVYANPPQPGPSFTQADFDAAWTLNRKNRDIEKGWYGLWKQLTGNDFKLGDVNRLIASQDKEYTDGSGTKRSPTNGKYEIVYARHAASIIAIHRVSPLANLESAGGVPHDQAQQQIPHLHRASDMTWYLWLSLLSRNDQSLEGAPDTLPENAGKDPQDPGRLRYLGNDYVSNPTSESIIAQVLREQGKEGVEIPYEERLTFGMDTDEGKALLGTPNAGAVAWICMHRFQELGKRRLEVSLWTGDWEDYYDMVWYLGDV
ncbi:MAG: hypothetical protein Q9174_004511 [Haloplaca sp. 1 TL-2023]